MYSKLKKVVFIILGSYILIASFHLWLNLEWNIGDGEETQTRFRVGFLPVT